jgi:hypothetical protein
VDRFYKKKSTMPTELCNEVGDPANFYFIYPAESKINGYLDINQAVKQDAGQTSVCMIYLTHMIGKARAVAMMVDKKALAEQRVRGHCAEI